MKLTQIHLKPDDGVPFVVVCRPKSGLNLDDMRRDLRVENIQDFEPEEEAHLRISRSLRSRGIKVYPDSTRFIVSATGTANQFQDLFSTKLTRYRRDTGKSGNLISHEFCSIDPNAPAANTKKLPDALLIIPVEPTCEMSEIPPPARSFHLRHPVDIAIQTRAAQVHRKSIKGQRATGSGIRIAMIDTGFYPHPFYAGNGYKLAADRAADVNTPATVDAMGHGTRNAVNIFSCAPDAEVIGIKKGPNPILALNRAAAHSPNVITCSWGYERPEELVVSDKDLPLRLTILHLIRSKIAVVFSGGNNGEISFPAMMPEVIAVGGVAVDKSANLSAWDGGSSYVSRVFANRAVPDLCGLASNMALPVSPETDISGSSWEIQAGCTSAATPQIAGVIALLLQKNPKLLPEEVKAILCKTAQDVQKGRTASKDRAVKKNDLATGAGLVDALKAWEYIREK
jgi:subtilisin family serine protease